MQAWMAEPCADALLVGLAEDLGLRDITADEGLYRAVSGDIAGIVLLRDW